MRLATVLFLTLIGGCGGTLAADHAAYLAGECGSVTNDALHDECLFFAVAATPADAESLCGSVRRGHFKDACFYMAADAAKVTGEDAAQACRKAGVYAHECLGHVILRDFETAEPDRLGARAMVEKLRDIHRRYGRPDPETRLRVLDAVKARAAKDPLTCGEIPDYCAAAGVSTGP